MTTSPMRSLTFLEASRFEWRDLPDPVIAAETDAIVRPLAVARCDLDLYIALGHPAFPGPFAFGHETVAEVVDAGEKAGVRPGERVVVPFQLSCGRCGPCRRGWTNTCEAFPHRAAYGLKPSCGKEFGGALADLMHVPFADFMLVKLPAGLDPAKVASAADNVPDGWRAVAPHLKERAGATVLVVGGLAQSVGLYAVASAVALKAGRVLYLDDDPARRAIAAKLGAEAEALVLSERRPEPFEITVDAAGDPDTLQFVIASTMPNGVTTSVAMYFTPTTPLPLVRMYAKGNSFHTGRVHARAGMPAVLQCCAEGHLHPEIVTTRTVTFEEAPDAMTDGSAKLVFVR